jgi:hypothetical protein
VAEDVTATGAIKALGSPALFPGLEAVIAEDDCAHFLIF